MGRLELPALLKFIGSPRWPDNGSKGIKPDTWYRLNSKGKPVALTAKELNERGMA